MMPEIPRRMVTAQEGQMDGRNERVGDERRREERFGSLDVVRVESEARVGETRRMREKEREKVVASTL